MDRRGEEAAGDAAGLLGHGGEMPALGNGPLRALCSSAAPSLCREARPTKHVSPPRCADGEDWLAAQPGLLHPSAQCGAEIGRQFVAEVQISGASTVHSASGSKTDNVGIGAGSEACLCGRRARPACAGPAAIHVTDARSRRTRTHAATDEGCPHHGESQSKAADAAPGQIPAAFSRRFNVGGHGEWSVATIRSTAAERAP